MSSIPLTEVFLGEGKSLISKPGNGALQSWQTTHIVENYTNN